jgi:hypothetical protein
MNFLSTKLKKYPHKLNKFQINLKSIKKDNKTLKAEIFLDAEDFGVKENGLDKCLKLNAKSEKDNGKKK